jgi:hypothetical protein
LFAVDALGETAASPVKRPFYNRKNVILKNINITHDIKIMDDKRKFERFDITAPARLEILKPGEKTEKMLLESRDLSAGGVFIKTPKSLPEGFPVKVEIFLHFQEPEIQLPPSDNATVIVVTGQVIRSTDEGMAIRFNDDYDITAMGDPGILNDAIPSVGRPHGIKKVTE